MNIPDTAAVLALAGVLEPGVGYEPHGIHKGTLTIDNTINHLINTPPPPPRLNNCLFRCATRRTKGGMQSVRIAKHILQKNTNSTQGTMK